MPFLLTGDVHHMSMHGADQKFFPKETTEVDYCISYLEICNEYSINPILFFTGKIFEEESNKVKQMYDDFEVVIGGHTYSAFKPKILYGIFNRLFRKPCGPKFLQMIDIAKTKKIINEVLGVDIFAWRGHAYRCDEHTNKLLKKYKFRFVSNEVNPYKLMPYKTKDDIISLPLNVIPDHEYLSHSSDHEGDMCIKEWLDKVKDQVKYIDNKGGVATILAHPGCMALEDRFQGFRELCEFLSNFDQISLDELLNNF